MTEINTMSAAVDLCVARSGRVSRRADIVAFVRQTIYELQTRAMFRRDLVEDQLTANADPYVWEVPKRFRRLLPHVQYPGLFDEQGNPIYAREIDIGMRQNRFDWYWYQSGDSIVFVGHAATASATQSINVAYFSFAKPLAYYATESRPATFSLEDDEWSYLTATTDDDKEIARALVTNWLLENWFDTCVEGALAKLYKVVGDDRAVTTFAMYKQLEATLLAAEPSVSVSASR